MAAGDPTGFLAKAAESLASAEDDLAKRRHNSCARGGYYAAFQAAVAALVAEGILPVRRWEHEFVSSEFQGRLIYRRKMYSGDFRELLTELFDLRARADYTERSVSAREAERLVDKARRVVAAVMERTKWP